jgi:hypothetical protein
MLAITYNTKQIEEVLLGGKTASVEDFTQIIGRLLVEDVPASMDSFQLFDGEGNLIGAPVYQKTLITEVQDSNTSVTLGEEK